MHQLLALIHCHLLSIPTVFLADRSTRELGDAGPQLPYIHKLQIPVAYYIALRARAEPYRVLPPNLHPPKGLAGQQVENLKAAGRIFQGSMKYL